MARLDKIQEMLKSAPGDTFLNYALAMEYVAASRADEALATFRRVRALDPNYVAAYFQQGQLLAGQGERAAAAEILQEGIAVARRVGDAHASGEMQEFLDSLT